MVKKNCVPFKRAQADISPVQQEDTKRAARYNYTEMKAETINAEKAFPARLCALREQKGVSAREMSLSLGQGAGYINNIENGNNLPSMSMFFEICEYLGISAGDFFAYTTGRKVSMISSGIARLSDKEQDLIMTLVMVLTSKN